MSKSILPESLHISAELLHVIIVMALAWLLIRLSRKLIRLFRDFMGKRHATAEETRRIETLARVFRYISSVAISLIAGMLVLSEFGISIAPILGAAGVVGLAVGFGAQSLIKDYFNGFFLLLENQIRQGDVVEVGGKSGLVEDVTLRYICLRDYDGNVHYIPNGLITTVTNMSRGYAYAVIDVSVAYDTNIDDAFAVMRNVARELRAAETFAAKILEDIEIAGVEKWADSAIVLRCRFKTVALAQWDVRREFLRRVKEMFDARGIEIPYPHLDVRLYDGRDEHGGAQEI